MDDGRLVGTKIDADLDELLNEAHPEYQVVEPVHKVVARHEIEVRHTVLPASARNHQVVEPVELGGWILSDASDCGKRKGTSRQREVQHRDDFGPDRAVTRRSV